MRLDRTLLDSGGLNDFSGNISEKDTYAAIDIFSILQRHLVKFYRYNSLSLSLSLELFWSRFQCLSNPCVNT